VNHRPGFGRVRPVAGVEGRALHRRPRQPAPCHVGHNRRRRDGRRSDGPEGRSRHGSGHLQALGRGRQRHHQRRHVGIARVIRAAHPAERTGPRGSLRRRQSPRGAWCAGRARRFRGSPHRWRPVAFARTGQSQRSCGQSRAVANCVSRGAGVWRDGRWASRRARRRLGRGLCRRRSGRSGAVTPGRCDPNGSGPRPPSLVVSIKE